jgi:hypothetical protein
MDCEMTLEPKHVAFLIEMLNTPGMAFSLEKARVAIETLDRLQEMKQSAQDAKPQ